MNRRATSDPGHTGAHTTGAHGAHKTRRSATHVSLNGEISSKTRKRRRAIPDIHSSIRLEEKFIALLNDPDPDLIVYVYRLLDGRTLKPALLHAYPFPSLLSHIQEDYGGGAFGIFIRRGPRMELTGGVLIAAPLR